MLFSTNANIDAVQTQEVRTGESTTADTGKIRLGGACRLPVTTADTGKIRLGGACRLPLKGA